MSDFKGIMIQGTSSDAGKSFIVTGLCRVLSDMGCKVAPFKSQNMSNNSYVTYDGKEIGRAQGAQAEAARTLPTVYMNPILLKPMMDHRSEIVLLGEVYKPMNGVDYQKSFTLDKGMETVRESLEILSREYDTLVVEGAGSPAEINLSSREIVNMRIARLLNMPVILVTDIDRGGAFASLVGTLDLVGENRRFIKGVIINKFRGDISLLSDGLKWFEEYTGVPVIGVMPQLEDVSIETEDSLSMHRVETYKKTRPLDIAVIGLQRVSNNTDVEPFIFEEDVQIRYVHNPSEFGNPHAVIIPGTKSTQDDLLQLQEVGLDKCIIDYADKGGIVFGVCGGYQILGETICDEVAVDREEAGEMKGLGLLPLVTNFEAQKRVRRVSGKIVSDSFKGIDVSGYEIHLGHSAITGEAEAFLKIEDYYDGALINNGQIIGCYLHNIFHNDAFRTEWLNMVRRKAGYIERELVDTAGNKERSFEKLAEACRKHLDIDAILKLMETKIY